MWLCLAALVPCTAYVLSACVSGGRMSSGGNKQRAAHAGNCFKQGTAHHALLDQGPWKDASLEGLRPQGTFSAPDQEAAPQGAEGPHAA